MLTVRLQGDAALIKRLQVMPGSIQAALVRKVTQLTLMLEQKVKGKLTDDVLHVRTGKLHNSVFHEVEADSTKVIGKVGAGRNVAYAAIHEFGGQTKAHVIEAMNGKALYFQMAGKPVFAKRVNHPGSTIPERSYLRSSLAEMKEEIIDGMAEAIREGARKR